MTSKVLTGTGLKMIFLLREKPLFSEVFFLFLKASECPFERSREL